MDSDQSGVLVKRQYLRAAAQHQRIRVKGKWFACWVKLTGTDGAWMNGHKEQQGEAFFENNRGR